MTDYRYIISVKDKKSIWLVILMNYDVIKSQAISVIEELIKKAELKNGQLLVIGCSSSEIVGKTIGQGSSVEAAEIVFDEIYRILKEKNIELATQCCEHLNRALIMERESAEKRGYEIVCVVPQPKAGGSFSTAAFKAFSDPVAVEKINADAGLDIGLTLIGMHLKAVAVPLRLENNRIGDAIITAAKTRPKFIGGCRAHYE